MCLEPIGSMKWGPQRKFMLGGFHLPSSDMHLCRSDIYTVIYVRSIHLSSGNWVSQTMSQTSPNSKSACSTSTSRLKVKWPILTSMNLNFCLYIVRKLQTRCQSLASNPRKTSDFPKNIAVILTWFFTGSVAFSSASVWARSGLRSRGTVSTPRSRPHKYLTRLFCRLLPILAVHTSMIDLNTE